MHSPSLDSPPPVDIMFTKIGNCERKAVLELVVEQGEVVTEDLVHGWFDNIHDASNLGHYTPYDTALIISNSHRLAGSFVAPEKVTLDTWQAHKILNSDVQDAVAGYALKISTLAEVDLVSVFGPSNVPGPNSRAAPHVRLRMFRGLAELAPGK